MIDLTKIRIFFKNEYCSPVSQNGVYVGAHIEPVFVHQHGVKLSCGELDYTSDGVLFMATRLFHPFESLPSHYSKLAFKVRFGGDNYFPHIELNCSPAKLTQGHNAFGSDDLDLCCKAVMFTFLNAFPDIIKLLDLSSAELTALDVTYSSKVENHFQAKKVIQALSDISTGKSRATRSFETTASWNYGSDLVSKIAYLKEVEINRQVENLKKLQKQSSEKYIDYQLAALQTAEVQDFVKNNVRFEAKYRRKYFIRNDIPTNIFKLCKYIKQQRPNLINELWVDAFMPIFNTFEGKMINVNDNNEVYNQCVKHFGKYVGKGENKKFVVTKAKNVYSFFLAVKTQSLEVVRDQESESTFYRKLSELKQIMPEAQIRTLFKSSSNVVQLVNLINVDFKSQHPEGYQEPTHYLRLVS